MKIVRHGRSANRDRRFYCQSCGCIFDAERDEYSYEIDCRNETIYSSICPECGTTSYISASVPEDEQ